MDLLNAALELAVRQHGWIRTSQVLDLGLPRSTFNDWCRAGRFVAGPRGIWRPAHLQLTDLSNLSLAVLASGPESAVTGAAGLFLQGVLDEPPEVVRVVHPMRRAGSRHLGDLHIRVVPSRTLRVSDVTAKDSIRCAVPRRALVDECHRPFPTIDHVRGLVIRTLQRRRATIPQLDEQLRHCRHVKGIVLLEKAVDQVRDSGADSYFTHEVWARLVAEGFPVDDHPRVVRTVARLLHPDITLLDGRVAVECDGLAFHHSGEHLFIDERKRRAYRAAGVEPIRISWLEFTTDWRGFATSLRGVLAKVRRDARTSGISAIDTSTG